MQTIFTIVVFLVMGISSCQSQPASGLVDPKTFNAQIQSTKDPVILDVRTPEEFTEGYIKGAINVDIYEPDFKDKVNKLDKSKTYFVYCYAGGRSSDAANLMRKEGFTKVIDLDGGIAAWKQNKLPLVVD